jgi:capsular exopolysaccharide synthesis family protein
VDLIDYVAMLRRRLLILVLCLGAGIVGGLYLGHHGHKQYAATAQCFVNIPKAGSVADQLAGSQLSSNLVETYASLATSRAVAQRVVTSLGLDRTADSLAGDLSADAQQSTYLINITATESTPTSAQSIANSAARSLAAIVTQLHVGNATDVSVQVVNGAPLPQTPIRPRPKLDLALGLILGLLAGLALAALLEALDRTVKFPRQAAALLETPLLAMIPKRRGKNSGGLTVDTNGPEGEPYRSLRTAVQFLAPDKPLRTIVVTSPMPDEGKTTTAVNLASALALSGERVILVDADLRRAGLAEVTGLERSVGLTSLVLGKASVDEALQSWRNDLKVLTSGTLPPNPSEILGSQFVNRLLLDLTNRADVVVIDAPPVLPVTDAVVLGAQVDGVIMVVRYGATLRHSAAEARRRIESVGANLVGYVFNALPSSESKSYYASYASAEKSLPLPTTVPSAALADSPRDIATTASSAAAPRKSARSTPPDDSPAPRARRETSTRAKLPAKAAPAGRSRR